MTDARHELRQVSCDWASKLGVKCADPAYFQTGTGNFCRFHYTRFYETQRGSRT